MLTKHINGFIEYCKVSGFSGKSIQSLSTRLNEFNSFLKPYRIRSFKKITYRHLLDFVADYKNPSNHIKKPRVWSLRQFFHFLKLHGLIDENIAKNVPYPKIEKTVPQFLTISEYNRILRYFSEAADSFIGIRNLIIIMMLGLLGLRTGTIISLNISDVDVVTGLLRVTEKGKQNRSVVMPKILCKALKQYLDQSDHYRGALFVTKRRKRISQRSLQDIFRSAAGTLGIDKHLHAHLFRHTAATHLNKVAGTTITQFVLGHSRRKNTLKYAHLNPDVYVVYMKKHPYMNL